MPRYIDADKLCEELKLMAKHQDPYKQNTILGVVSTIENWKTADVVEVKHGEWRDSRNGTYTCSVCGGKASKMIWCGRCGAKMDGGKE